PRPEPPGAAPAALQLDPDQVPGAGRDVPVTVGLTWIGQAGFLVSTPATRLAIAPFLSDHPDRRYPSPVGPGDLAGTELVLATHQHLDHLDAPAVAALLELDARARGGVPAPARAPPPPRRPAARPHDRAPPGPADHGRGRDRPPGPGP